MPSPPCALQAAEDSEEGLNNRRRQLALAIASPLLGAALFAAKKNAKKVVSCSVNCVCHEMSDHALVHTQDPVAILRAMERRSPPIQVSTSSLCATCMPSRVEQPLHVTCKWLWLMEGVCRWRWRRDSRQ